VTDRLLRIVRRPQTWVVACVIWVVLGSLGRLFALFVPAWTIGRIASSCNEEGTVIQCLKAGLPRYVHWAANAWGISDTEAWVRFGGSFFLALCWLALAYFLLRHRPWARVGLFFLLALGAGGYAVSSVVNALGSPAPVLDLETVVYFGALLFVFTRRGVVGLFGGNLEA
jgi:hypothetical protein